VIVLTLTILGVLSLLTARTIRRRQRKSATRRRLSLVCRRAS
jgi:hypothetical protein